jgi:hypothetical protein
MRSTYFICLLVISVIASSCSTYQAVTKKHENLQYEAVKVYPEWKYLEPRGKKLITPVIGLVAGAAYGYNTDFTYEGKTYKKAENAAIWGGIGLLAGAIINRAVFPDRRHSRKKFDLTQSEEWLKDYNKSTKNDYLIHKSEPNNAIVLISERKLDELRRQYKVLVSDIESENPSTSFNSLQNWKSQLNGQYSILPASEINLISTAISKNEQKIAGIELTKKVNILYQMPDEHESIESLTSFKGQNQPLFIASNRSLQEKCDKTIEDKINAILNIELPKEIATLEKIGNKEDDLNMANSFQTNFSRKYDRVSDYKQVRNVYAKIKSKRTSIVKANADSISKKIKKATTHDQLNRIESDYLFNVESSDYSIMKLKAQIEERREEINEQTRIIVEKQQQAIEEEFKRKMKELTDTGEPTEWQMEYAVRMQLAGQMGLLDEMASRTLQDDSTPIDQIEVIIAKIAKLFDTRVVITYFEKEICGREGSSGSAGYVCDYIIEVKSTLSTNPTRSSGKARFFKAKNGNWKLKEQY